MKLIKIKVLYIQITDFSSNKNIFEHDSKNIKSMISLILTVTNQTYKINTFPHINKYKNSVNRNPN